MADRWDACRRILSQSSKSFDLAARLLPRARRNDVAALYAWCRTCDDAIDLSPPANHQREIERLRAGLRSIYRGERQPDPVLDCFQEVVQRHAIPLAYPIELLDGMDMDVAKRRYETVDDLLVYCWRVAGTVGTMMCHVLGTSEPVAARHAAHLGIAMQLTNICRDVAEDWRLGRLYVPARLLPAEVCERIWSSASGAEAPPLPDDAAAAFEQAVRSLLDLADLYYASADHGLGFLSPRAALAVRTARLVYAEIGRELERRGCDVFGGRVSVSTTRKLDLVGRALRQYASERRGGRRIESSAPPETLIGSEAVRL